MRDILREYATTLDVDLCFQGFAGELVALPGRYAGPRSALLTAIADQTLAGCAVLRCVRWITWIITTPAK